MTFAPDYGLKFKTSGTPDDFEAVFIPFEMFKLGIDLEEGLYSTTSNVNVDGQVYALTLDFDEQMFERLLEVLPAPATRRIRAALDSRPVNPVMFEFPAPISLIVRARFGEQQANAEEDYVPMRVVSVSACPAEPDGGARTV